MSSIWDLPNFQPYAARFRERQSELSRRAGYYDGSVYSALLNSLARYGPRVTGNIKPLFLPLSRAVDVDAGVVPGGWALDDDAPEAWGKGLDQLFRDSQWATQGVLLVHYGAVYGVSVLKVADVRAQNKVVLSPVDPCCVITLNDSVYGTSPDLAICVERRVDTKGSYEYAEVVTRESVSTYRDGALTGFDGRPAEYPNELQFVPFVEVRHIETGNWLGEATYQKVMPLLDQLNTMATHLSDIVRKHSDPQWVGQGMEPAELTHSSGNMWFIPQGADVKALVPQIDVAGVLAFIKTIEEQVHQGLPELAFDQLRAKENIATATVELQLAEMSIKIRRIRPNYDAGLSRACQMAGAAAIAMGLPTVAPLADPAFSFDPNRPIIPLDQKSELELEKLALEVDMLRKQAEVSYP